jgi:hypothetical protein
MTYDEFADKLRKAKSDYLTEYGKKLETIDELETFLTRRLIGKKKTGLKSLRGIIP